MPRFNFTFQEASPLITYTGLWLEGSPTLDPDADQYNGSFRVTNATGAKATFNFNGTGVTLFGALRDNHGDYSVDLDQAGNPSTYNGHNVPNIFQRPLWQAYGLAYGKHTVEVTNEPTSGPYFDLDFVSIEREIGQDSDTIFHSTIDDTSPFVNYSGAWQPDSTLKSQNFGQTLHQTATTGSQVAITFQGCCIELYGLYANATYKVGVDNNAAQETQGKAVDPSAQHPQTLLYFVDGLSEDVNHTITLAATGTDAQRPFYFDYAVVRSTQAFRSDGSPFTVSASSHSLNQQSSSQGTAQLGLAIGLSVAGIVLLALMATAYIVLRRRRMRNAPARMDIEETQDYMSPETPSASEISVWRLSAQDTKGRLQSHSQRWSAMQSIPDTVTHSGAVRSVSSIREGKAQPPIPEPSSASDTDAQASGSVELPPTKEREAGFALEEHPSTLPPAYNPDWNQSRS